MSAAAIRDAVAAKIAALPSGRNVYSAAATSTPNVLPWPQDLLDEGPHALVGRGASGRRGGTGNQYVDRGVDVEWRLSALDYGAVQLLVDTLEDEILAEFSSGITLGGIVVDCVYAGSDAPADILDEDSRPWLRWVTHFTARERVSLEMTP